MKQLEHKIIPFNRLGSWRDNLIGEKLVVTNGCFDIVHLGHIHYLSKARRMGTFLLVGLNSDKSVKSQKGQSRPINKESERALFLCAFDFVSAVCVFPGKTATQFLDLSRPNVYVKGGDYNQDTMNNEEKGVLEKHESRLAFTDYIENKSTTNIISVIKEEEKSV